MTDKKKIHPKLKTKLHPRNKHQARYKFDVLTQSFPALKPFVFVNEYEDETIDFFNPLAVKALNQALIKHYYKIDDWQVPEGYLSPPIPGRADYIHYIADLLQKSADPYGRKPVPTGSKVKCCDIGTGASCIYALLGNAEYRWSFTATDTDQNAITSASKILAANPRFQEKITLVFQKKPELFLKGILKIEDHIAATICNPPFHSSAAEARAATIKKLNNLKKSKTSKPVLNFGGQQNELWYPGGELAFVEKLIKESKSFNKSVLWFTALISKQSNLKPIYEALRKVEAVKVKTIEMGQGNKTSRIVAWTYKNDEAQIKWMSQYYM